MTAEVTILNRTLSFILTFMAGTALYSITGGLSSDPEIREIGFNSGIEGLTGLAAFSVLVAVFLAPKAVLRMGFYVLLFFGVNQLYILADKIPNPNDLGI